MAFKNFLFTLVVIPVIITGCATYPSDNPMRTELTNGMVVLTRKCDSLPVVAISVWAKVGSADEEKENHGISHFLEHMLFRKKPPSGRRASIQAEIEGAGGYLNGATSKEITFYYAVVPKDFAEEALYLLLDLFLNPDFDEKDFAEEKKVVIEEISRKQDNPSDLAVDLLFETLYAGHPYGHCVLGDEETIKNMPLDSLIKYHAAHYHSGNMVVSMAGDFEPEAVVKGLKTRFGEYQKRLPKVPTEAKIKKGVREATVEKNVNQVYLTLGFAGPAVENDDHIALDLLAVILGGSVSSRLVERLKEKEELVNAVSCQFFTQKESGIFSVYAQFLPGGFEKVEAIIWEELERVKNELVANEELEKARRMIEADFHFQREIFKDQALNFAYWECLAALDYEKNYLAKVKKIDSGKLREIATEYLDSQNFARVIIRPAS
ncbi:MAG: pitrilysin family protein [Candidatus Ratteibacteria bacterium]|nr:pitrilysin family protein [Candidatus Ratteibacteria bacterium]